MKHGRALAMALVVFVSLVPSRRASASEWTEPKSWGGGPTLGVSQTNAGNLVKLWQGFLDARFDGWFYDGGPTPSLDGTFGPTTRNYTILWQTQYGLTADGVVGPNTWNRARWFNLKTEASPDPNWASYRYHDDAGDVYLDFARPYATWLKPWCDVEYHITTPQIDHGWWGAPCD
jgi:hypothetical protein